MRLIVKGGCGDTAAALAVRGLQWGSLNMREDHTTVTLLREHRDDPALPALLSRWLCEDTPLTPGEGYPAGTLLWYGE